jgi:hypothetical protein
LQLAIDAAILHAMLRLSRRCSTALLWLAIALLPVRGWAVTLMPLAMGLPAPAHAAALESNAAAPVATMPCHSAMSADAHDSDTAATTTCSLCDLCHSTVAQAPSPLSLPAAPDDALPPAAAPSPVDSRLPDGLFRPPQSTLA